MNISTLLNSYHFLQFTVFHGIFIIALLASNARSNVAFGFATNETDHQALFSLKDQITYDHSGVLSSWNHSLHFCQWKGITCSRQRQRVTMLDLSSQKLVGSLSPQIGNLTFLREIYLQNNYFHGSIPQEVGRLFRLRSLVLANNTFQGEFPNNLSHCLTIRVIRMGGNNLGGKIPNELGSLSNLLYLALRKNRFAGQIPPSLGNLSSLWKLGLGLNNLAGNIPSTLALLSNLEAIDLGMNNLSGVVPLPLYNISSLNDFSIVGNQLKGELPPNLGLTLPNIKKFCIDLNKFSGPFPASIVNASKLVYFDIAVNNFSGPITVNFGSLQNLEVLNLNRNQFGSNQPNELGSLIKSLVNCTNLRFLQLTDNRFRGELPSSIVNLSTSLTTLDLSQNHISGTIPQEIGNLVNLMVLALSENMLSGSIPKFIGELSKMEQLFLNNNNISGEIPASIGNMTRLSIISFNNNVLQGGIPISLGSNILNLLVLDLQSNSLTGVIPEQIFGLSSMFFLYVNQNRLRGALSLKIGILKNLVEMDISVNEFTGEIPSTLGNCLMLEVLRMDHNYFQGTIPSSFKQLKSMKALDLSNNNLSGQIPSFLGVFPFFEYLNLSHNRFEGELPTQGVFRNITAIVVVGNLQLCGGIQALKLPACPINVPNKRRNLFPRRVIPLVIILVVLMLLVCLAAIIFGLKRSKRRNSSDSLLRDQYPKFSYKEILQATNGFSLTNLVGEGRYASVYKGTLSPSAQIVAVKVFNIELHNANTSFLAECETYRNIRHRNLIKIISSCSSIDFRGCDFKALILEFMPKGSLDGWLYPSLSEQNVKNLSLIQRLNIAIDVASAVDYLHHHLQMRIIHCDLKPSNVLLDDEFCAHVGDFGLAKFLSNSTSETARPHTSSSLIRGTIGYIPPEYGRGGELSQQGDLYSYGILLLEMFVGKRPTDNIFNDDFSLYNYVRNSLPHKVIEIVDPRIVVEIEDGSISEHNITKMEACLASVLQVGLLCSAEMSRERMGIKDVLRKLHGARNIFLEHREGDMDSKIRERYIVIRGEKCV